MTVLVLISVQCFLNVNDNLILKKTKIIIYLFLMQYFKLKKQHLMSISIKK